MANTSAAKKALRSSKAKEIVNKARKNRIRSFTRKVEDSIKSGNQADARVAFKALEPELMKGVTKNVLKLGTAARKLRKLSDSIRKLALAPKAVAPKAKAPKAVATKSATPKKA